MEILKVIILGIVQGLTEFLPVSSSGHLVLAAEFLNFHEEGATFEVFVHLGTFFSVIIYFRKDIFRMIQAPVLFLMSSKRHNDVNEYLYLDLYIIIGTIPAAVIGLLLKSEIEAAFSNIYLVLIMLVVTGTILLFSKFIKTRDRVLSPSKSFIIGIAQSLAILPGISRSGSTIVTGLFLGLTRENAARFSFLLALPAILGASLIKTIDILSAEQFHFPVFHLFLGTLSAFISGYFSIIWLLDIVKKGRLEWFAYYCYAIVTLSIIFMLISS